MRNAVADNSVDAASYGRNKVLSELGRATDAGFPPRVLADLRERAFVASESTTRRILGSVMGNLQTSVDDGLGIDDAAGRLEQEFHSMRDHELKRIARTEINRSQQVAAMETERELGVEFHEWVTAEDERVRETHLDQHGEIVRVGEEFSNGLVRPGDADGPLEEIINCRCRLAPFLMPRGYRAPADQAQFYESELVTV